MEKGLGTMLQLWMSKFLCSSPVKVLKKKSNISSSVMYNNFELNEYSSGCFTTTHLFSGGGGGGGGSANLDNLCTTVHQIWFLSMLSIDCYIIIMCGLDWTISCFGQLETTTLCNV